MDISSLEPPSALWPVFAFGQFRLEPDGTLLRAGQPVHLPPKELAALRLLLDQAGSVVTPAQLKQSVWADVHVTPDSILHCISSLRSLLGEEDRILTIYKRGYRFAGPVQRLPTAAPNLPRLAIMPFECAPGVPGELGELVAEETTASLTAAAAVVSIVARDSVFTLARRGLTAQQVGESLHADLVLAGTLRALPAHVRLRAEMVRVHDGAQIWVEDLFVDSDPAAPLQPLLAARIASRLGGRLAGKTAVPAIT
ncbi:MAG: winged helix-turn-helix domain-containing protein [Acidobacteriota bacterium]